MKSTKIELVDELETRNVGAKYDELINNAKLGLYHDFESIDPTPKSLLLIHLDKFPELEDIAEAVENGDYDE